MFGPQPAQIDSHQGNGHVGQGRSQVGLGQDHQHRHAHQQSGLDQVEERQFAPPRVGEVLGHRQDKYELDPLRGLEMLPSGKFDPAPRP